MSDTNVNAGAGGATTGQVVVRVIIAYLLNVLGAMTVAEAVPTLAGIARELHPTSPALIGLIMSLPGIVIAIGALATGWAVDRFGDKKLLSLGALINVVGDLMVPIAPSMSFLLWGRVVSGLGYVLLTVANMTIMVRMTTGKQRTWALTLWSTFVPASFILPLLTGSMVRDMGWRSEYYGHALVLFLVMIAGINILPPAPKRVALSSDHDKSHHVAGLLQVLKSPLIYILGLSFAGDSFLQNGVIMTIGPYLGKRYGADPILIDQWNVGSMFMQIIGCLLIGRLLTLDVSAKKLIVVALALLVIPAILLYAPISIGLVASIICAYVIYFANGIIAGMFCYVPCVSPSPEAQGATSGMTMQILMWGVLLAGPVWFVALSSPNARVMMMITILCAIAVVASRTPIVWQDKGPQHIAHIGWFRKVTYHDANAKREEVAFH